jgi:hypothetical protein
LATTRTFGSTGCYGFRLSGIPEAGSLLVEAPPHWPALALRHAPPDGEGPTLDGIGPDRAELMLQHGWVELDRPTGLVTFRLHRRPPDSDLVHPYLAPAAAVAARWNGRDSFHAGAVVVDGGAWAVFGDKGSGKSTTLAWLALGGHPVLTDDLLVVDGSAALAGPRCVDLRQEPSARLGVGEPLGLVGQRERWRLALGDVPAQVPLRGFVTLGWDSQLALEPLRGAQRLLALLPGLSVRVAPDRPAGMVDLSSLPVWQLRRPQRWDALREGAELLLDALRR